MDINKEDFTGGHTIIQQRQQQQSSKSFSKSSSNYSKYIYYFVLVFVLTNHYTITYINKYTSIPYLAISIIAAILIVFIAKWLEK